MVSWLGAWVLAHVMPLNFKAGGLSSLLLQDMFTLKIWPLVDSHTQLNFTGYKPIRCEQKTRASVDPQKVLRWNLSPGVFLVATKISAQLGVLSCTFHDFISSI